MAIMELIDRPVVEIEKVNEEEAQEEGERPIGVYSVRWDGRDGAGRPLASGLYIYQLRAGGREQTRKLLLLR